MNTLTLYDAPAHDAQAWSEKSISFDEMVANGYTVNISWGPNRIHVTCEVTDDDMVEFKLRYL